MMNSRSTTGYSTVQKLHPLSLLAQLISRQVNGHFRLSIEAVTWSLFLSQGKLNFATNTEGAFERLDQHLRRLSQEIPSLDSAVRVQVRLLFEPSAGTSFSSSLKGTSPDYQAICWLVEQAHLTSDQAAALIYDLAIDVIESFLGVQEGHYELLEAVELSQSPIFCRLDLRSIVEICQKYRRDRLSSARLPKGTSLPSVLSAPTADLGADKQSANSIETETPQADLKGQSAGLNGQRIPPYDPTLHFRPAARLSVTPAQPETVQSRKAAYTIACIDDSPTVLNAIQEFLDDKSLTVVPINDPVKALMQIMRSKPDLILLDVTMPNLDGYELCSLLRRHPQFKNTPIIMVTGNTGLIDRAKAKLVRASGYLTKPFSQSDLLKMVFMHLSA
jgi:chemotaxis family two-component system response regulator PixG